MNGYSCHFGDEIGDCLLGWASIADKMIMFGEGKVADVADDLEVRFLKQFSFSTLLGRLSRFASAFREGPVSLAVLHQQHLPKTLMAANRDDAKGCFAIH